LYVVQLLVTVIGAVEGSSASNPLITPAPSAWWCTGVVSLRIEIQAPSPDSGRSSSSRQRRENPSILASKKPSIQKQSKATQHDGGLTVTFASLVTPLESRHPSIVFLLTLITLSPGRVRLRQHDSSAVTVRPPFSFSLSSRPSGFGTPRWRDVRVGGGYEDTRHEDEEEEEGGRVEPCPMPRQQQWPPAHVTVPSRRAPTCRCRCCSAAPLFCCSAAPLLPLLRHLLPNHSSRLIS
jgi:hypothetical protein